MSENNENFGGRLLIPADDRFAVIARPHQQGSDSLLLLFQQDSGAETYAAAPEEPLSVDAEPSNGPVAEPALIPSDPTFSSQWHLLNTGQFGGLPGIDINVTQVWEDYTGQGVRVGVVDDGVEYTHFDLAANYDGSVDRDFGSNDDNAFPASNNSHGTAVAGLIAADDNGQGGVGVAYDSTITSYRIFGGTVTFGEFQDLFNRHVTADIDISSNSWTFVGEFADNFLFSGWNLIDAGIDNAVTNGRGGLGTVILFAAGNGRVTGDSSDYHNMQNSRETISVAAVDNQGFNSWYSNPGASLLIAAPSNGGTAGIHTTDRTGSLGYSSGDYTGSFGGTSAATPIASGVVALMLEANPNLGYRDVQEILAYSARMVEPGDSDWAWNGADDWNGGALHKSQDHGFGLIDAHGAVSLSETWTLQSTRANELVVSGSSAPGTTLIEGGAISDTITLTSGLKIDHVEVTLNITHNHIGDLIVKLVSPDGTESIIVERPDVDQGGTSDGESADNIFFTIGSTSHWGETGVGTWTLIVEDQGSGSTGSGTLVSWDLNIYGDALTGDDLYVYTDEYGSFTAPGDAGRRTLEDSSGEDTLNAAAVTTDIVLDLSPGAGGTLAGNSFSLEGSTVIENLVLGDGNDNVVGNAAANYIWGARGDDQLDGGAGNDTLGGGRGDDQLDGGADFDLALFSYAIEDYAISYVDAVSVTIDYIGGGSMDEGFDSLTNVEQFSFANVIFDFADLTSGDPPGPDTFFAIAPSDAVKDEGDVGTTAFSFTVTRSGVLTGTDQVDFAVTGAGADASDFGGSYPSGTLTFNPGETSQLLTIDVSGDTDLEADEGYTVTLSNASAGTEITTASAGGTIQNDDVAPPDTFFAIAPTDAVKAEGDGGTTSYSFTVTRSGDLSGADQVDFATTGAGANAADFGGSFPSGTLAFAAGETTKVVTIDVSGDTTFEADEGFTVTLSNASAGTEITTASANGTILNDDPPPPDTFFAIAPDDAVKAEGDDGTTNYSFTVTRSGDLSGADQVDFAVSSSDADAADFGGSLPSGTVSFASGETSKTVTIAVSGDTTFEADEDFTVTLTNASAGTEITTPSASGTILNDDALPPGEVQTLVDANFDGSGDSEGFTYADSVFGGPSDQPYASGQWESGALAIDLGGLDTADILDMSGAWQIDFTLDSEMSVSLSFVYELVQAQYYEADEFSQVLYSLSGGAPVVLDQLTGDGNAGPVQSTGAQNYATDLGILSAGTYTLSLGGYSNKKTYINELTEVFIDDVVVTGTPTSAPDPETFFSIAATDAIKAEGDSGTTNYSFTVTRSGVLSGADTVDFAVTGGSADAADFGGSLPSGTVSFAAGETSKLVTIAVTGDSDFEADEGFTVSLSNPSTGVIVSGADAGGTILNDDPWASFDIAPTDAVKAEGDSGTTPFSFTVTRSGDLSHADQVDYAVTGASAADFGGSLPSGTVSFVAGEASKVITVDVTGDTTFEADEGFTVTLSNASANTEITTASANGTILNDDPWATFAIAPTDAVKAEGDAGITPFSFTVTRSGDLSHADQVDYAVTGASAADFGGSLPSGTVAFAAGEASKVITVDVSGDTVFEADEGFTVTLSNASANTEITTASANGTILNDDPHALFAIAADDAVKAEGDSGTTNYTFTVTRSGVLSGADSVDYAVTGAGADAADFGGSLPIGTVSFATGESSKTVTVEVSGDADFEADEGFTVTLSNASAGTEITTPSAGGTIQNDDPWATFAIEATDAVKAEGDVSATFYSFTVTRSGDLSHVDLVDLAVTGGDADAADFLGGFLSGTVTFDPGEISHVVDVQVAGDTDFEADEDFTVALSNASAGTEITTASANGTILNDDPHATFSITGGTLLGQGAFEASFIVDGPLIPIIENEGDSGPAEFTFTVRRSGDLSFVDQVDYAVTGSGLIPASASDFVGGVLPSGTLTFVAGESSKSLVVQVEGDTDYEPSESFSVILSNASVGTEITSDTALGTIQNDDPLATYAIAPTDAVKAEGDSGTTQYSFTVTRSGYLGNAAEIDYTVTGAGADAADFGGSLPSGTIAFAAGESSKLLTIDVVGDTDFEADEGFTVTLSNAPSETEITTASANGTILNDDATPPATFLAIAPTDAVKAEGDAGTTDYNFTVTRSGDLSATTQVDYAVTGADASDFSGSLPSGSLSFAVGETSKLITVEVSGDTTFEADEGFTVTLSNASAGTQITTPSANGTILNDDPHASFAIAPTDAVKAEGDAGSTNYTFTVTRSGDLSNADTVDWAATGSGGDPANAADFGGLLSSGTLNFAAGQASKIVTVAVSGDAAFEADEGFAVTLSNASVGTEITTPSASGTILNDDPYASFAIAADDAVKAEGDSGTTDYSFTVTRSGDLSNADTVDWAVAGTGSIRPNEADFGGAFPSGTVSFDAGEASKTVTVGVAGDTTYESDEAFTVTLSNASAGTTIATATATGTIQNDDPWVSISIAPLDAVKAEGDGGTTSYSFWVTRFGVSGFADTVDWAVTGSGGNPADAADFGGLFPSGTVSFEPGGGGEFVTVEVTGDTIFEANEGFTVTLSNPSPGAEIGTGTASGTILNDDPHALFAIAADDAVKAEGDAGTTDYTFTVTRSGDLSGADQVDYAVTGADASDFGGSLPSGTVSFAAGESSKTVTIAVSGDTDVEADENFTVTLSNASAGTEITTAVANGTIQNDDIAPPPDATVTLVDADFDDDSEGFTYSDGVFGGSTSQDYADGQWSSGALSVALGGLDSADILDMSGAWQISFTLEAEMAVSVSFAYELIQSADYESDEFSQAYYSLSGSAPVLLAQLTGDGNLGPVQSTGVQTYNGDLGVLASGDYTLSIGGYNNKKTFSNESSEVRVDDVVVTGTAVAPPSTFFQIAASDATKAEGDSGTTSYSFTVTRSGDLSATDQVDFSVTGSGADPAAAADFFGDLLPDGTVSFAAGETSKVVTVEVVGDGFLEPDESFTVTLSNPTLGAAITTASAEGTILNDDDGSAQAILLSADFNAVNDTGGGAYVDGAFGGDAVQAYADGQWEAGALTIDLGGIDTADITDMSGAWQFDFTLDVEMSVSIEFAYQLTMEPHYEASEFSQILYGLSGQAPVVVDQLTGNGNGGPSETTGLQSFSADLGVLAAGDHSLSIGAYNNLKTYLNESSSLLIDDLLVIGTTTSPAGAAILAGEGAGGTPDPDPLAFAETSSLPGDELDLVDITVVA